MSRSRAGARLACLSSDCAPSFRLSGYVDGAITVSHERQNPLDLRLVGGSELTSASALSGSGSVKLISWLRVRDGETAWSADEIVGRRWSTGVLSAKRNGGDHVNKL